MLQVGLAGANLSAASFDHTEAMGCDLTQADLRGITWLGGRLEGCDLSRAKANGSIWRDMTMIDARFGATDFGGARFRNVVVEGGDTGYVRMEKAVLMGCRFHHPRLGGSPLMRARLAGAFLLECDLRHANLYSADLRGTVFVRTDLSDACLQGADLTDAVLLDCRTDRIDWDR